MKALEYCGLVEPWKVELVVARAKRMGFKYDQIDDAMQRIVPVLMGFRFDPCMGAKETTAVRALVDNRLKKMRRAEARYQAHLGRLAAEATLMAEVCVDGDLAFDMERAVAALPAKEQAVCRAFMGGDSIKEVAQALACGWHTVGRIARNIRQRFLSAGLDIYLSA